MGFKWSAIKSEEENSPGPWPNACAEGVFFIAVFFIFLFFVFCIFFGRMFSYFYFLFLIFTRVLGNLLSSR